jgi:hypothetical protein
MLRIKSLDLPRFCGPFMFTKAGQVHVAGRDVFYSGNTLPYH